MLWIRVPIGIYHQRLLASCARSKHSSSAVAFFEILIRSAPYCYLAASSRMRSASSKLTNTKTCQWERREMTLRIYLTYEMLNHITDATRTGYVPSCSPWAWDILPSTCQKLTICRHLCKWIADANPGMQFISFIHYPFLLCPNTMYYPNSKWI